MQNYQLTVLIKNSLDDKARTSLLDAINKDLGTKINQEAWGVRGLAYPIKHEEKAFYTHFSFEAEPSTIPAIDRKLKLNEDIIRYLLIKSEVKKESAKTEDKKTTTKITKKAEKSEKAEEAVEETPESPEEK